MKRSLIFKNLTAIMLVSAVVFFSSCVKNRNDGAVDFSQLTPIMQIPEGGLKNFAASALLFDASHASDTATFRVNYAATTVAPADIVVTLAVNDAARLAYNAANPTGQYEKMPDSLFKFTQTSVTIKAGQSYSDIVKLAVYPNKIDQSKSYMVPISITNASGVNISGNYGTIYYHVIGNPLAGKYDLIGTRYNYSGQVTYAGPVGASANIPAGFVSTTNLTALSPKTASPIDAQTVTMSFSNLGFGTGFEYGYLITGNPTFSAITYDFNTAVLSVNSNINKYIVAGSYVPPSPTQKPAFRLITHYNNALGGAGNDRIIDEDLKHQ